MAVAWLMFTGLSEFIICLLVLLAFEVSQAQGVVCHGVVFYSLTGKCKIRDRHVKFVYLGITVASMEKSIKLALDILETVNCLSKILNGFLYYASTLYLSSFA